MGEGILYKRNFGATGIVWLFGVALLIATAITMYFAFSAGWQQGDWVSLSFGIIVASAQVLAVYALIEPKLMSWKEKEKTATWNEATREFLATCVLTSRDITDNLRRQIGAENAFINIPSFQRSVFLRTGIREALTGLANKSTTFDTTIRLCARGFSDADLASLSMISSELRSAADNALDARNRLDIIINEIKPISKLQDARIIDQTFPSDYTDTFDWNASWFVNNLLRVIDGVTDAGELLEEFVFSSRPNQLGSEAEFEEHLAASKRYTKINKRREDDNKLTIGLHRGELKIALDKLRGFMSLIETNGICMAWEHEEQDPANDDAMKFPLGEAAK